MTARRNTPLTPVNCGARIHPECYHGKMRKHWREDGTYNVMGNDTIVCDPCYLMAMSVSPSGRGTNEELPAAILAIVTKQAEARNGSG